jgi:hypothetical protein
VGGLFKYALEPEPNFAAIRIDYPEKRKEFIQAHKEDGGWCFGGLPVHQLWALPDLKDSEDVIVVEGEKCAIKAASLGFVATTSPGGSGSARKADWKPLAGKRVAIWPDFDESGTIYAQAVLSCLRELEPQPRIRMIDPKTLNLPEKGDIVDYAALFDSDDHAKAGIRAVLDGAAETGHLAVLDSWLRDAKSGIRYAAELPWPCLDRDSRLLAPGTVTILAGSAGSTKSFALVQMARHWASIGEKAAVLMLEDGAAFHLRRALAQISSMAGITDDAWCRAHPHEVDDARAKARDELSALEGIIDSPGTDWTPTPKMLAMWVRAKAEAGRRVLAIDPATAMVRTATPWIDDELFLASVKRAMEDTGASLLLISHPKTAAPRKGGASMDMLSGGACYQRFSQNLIWLEYHKTPITVTVAGMHETHKATINRTIMILKNRSSRGQGRAYGLCFDSESLTLTEAGRIEREEGT